MPKNKSDSNANDFLLAISLFQKKHPYTEILSVSRDLWFDPASNNNFWAYAFKTNKSIIYIRVDNISN